MINQIISDALNFVYEIVCKLISKSIVSESEAGSGLSAFLPIKPSVIEYNFLGLPLASSMACVKCCLLLSSRC